MSTERQPFNIARNDQCFCESGKRFKRCCGSLNTNRNTPHGIVIVDNFVSPEACLDILKAASTRSSERVKVFDQKKSTEEEIFKILDDSRVTERVEMSNHQSTLDALVARAVSDLIEPNIGSTFDWFEQPQLLKYNPGGFYSWHADSENYDHDKKVFLRAVDRDISLLLYLDEDYEGGEILFTNFDYKVKPRPGMLIYFPSDNRYVHTALAVTRGTRHVIVSWLSQHGVEKLRKPPENAVQLLDTGDSSLH